MGERIAKASKVPLAIRFVRLGRVAVCVVRVWRTEGHKNEWHTPIRKYLIVIGPNPPSVGYSVNYGRTDGSIPRSIIVCKTLRHD